tara:strand:+ start:160 stop:912 length:753 start_codon:yes stop_codon:yes gene_type:complete
VRRNKGKLNKFNWRLVLFAGIFQIITFVFDQAAIQYEEKNRAVNFKILSLSESRSAFLKMNNRVNDFLLAFENSVFFVTSSNFSSNKKKYLYFANVFDQTRLMEDIINDFMVKDALKVKTIEAGDLDDPEYKTKIYKFEEYIRILIDNNHWLTEEITKDSNSDFESQPGIFNPVEDVIRAHVEHNNYYLHDLLNVLATLNIESSSKLKDLINNSSIIESRKQLMLLTGVVSQLFSLLFLLILFRNILNLK